MRVNGIPNTTWLKLGWAWLVVIAFTVCGGTWLAEPLTPATAAACFAVLFFTIVAACSAWSTKRTSLPTNWANPTAR